MRPLPTPSTISRVLFEIDPMHTCCRESACFDEYDRVAADAALYLENGHALGEALHQALQDSFGFELTRGRDLSRVLAMIESPASHAAAEPVPYHSEIDGRGYREYLLTFSDTGPIRVRVKFAQEMARIAERRMKPQEINSLIDPRTGDFFTAMTFDEHLFELTRIDLSLTRKTLTIHARQPGEEATADPKDG